MTDMVNHPPHYNAYSVEVIEVTRYCSFNIGNAIKYMLRHLHKGKSQEDLEKALWYLRDHVEHFHKYDTGNLGQEWYGNLLTLTNEYYDQEGAMDSVAASLSFLLVGDVVMAEMFLSKAVEGRK